MIEAIDRRAEAFEMFRLAAGGDGGHGAAVKRAFERDQTIPFGPPARRLVFARHLDGAFQRFRTGVGEEDLVGESGLAQTVGETFRFRNAVKIGNVPEFGSLFVQRGNKTRMRMTKRIDGDT